MKFANFRIHKNRKNLAFSRILLLLDCQKISIETNYENSQGNNSDIEVKMCFITPENCFWAIQILQVLSQNTPKIKTVFGYPCMEVHQFCHDWARNNNVGGSLNEPLPHPSYFNVFKIAHTEYG